MTPVSPGHSPKYKPMGSMQDAIVCSCGFQTETLENSIEKVWDQWLKHARNEQVQEAEALMNRSKRSI